MKLLKASIISAALFLLSYSSAFSYMDINSHDKITEESLKKAEISDYFDDYLGFEKGITRGFFMKNKISCIKECQYGVS